MFFQIDVAPKERKSVVLTKKAEKICRFSLLLAPFQPQTHIELEATVNTTVEYFLDVKNTTGRSINVVVTKAPPDERNISLNLSEVTIPANDVAEICIKWTPKEYGSWRDVLQLVDNRKIKYDVIIIAATTGPKAAGDKSKIKSQRKTWLLEKDSSKNFTKKLVQNNAQVKRSTSTCATPFSTDPCTKKPRLNTNCVRVDNKENICNNNKTNAPFNVTIKKDQSIQNKLNLSYDFSKFLDSEIVLTQRSQELRRETYVKGPRCSISNTLSIVQENQNDCEESIENRFDDSISPITGQNGKSEFSMIIDNLALTSTEISEKPQQTKFAESACALPKIGNETFDISPAKSEENSSYLAANGTYEIPQSPIEAKHGTQQNRLLQNFGCLSPVMYLKDDLDASRMARHIIASSPIPCTMNVMANCNNSKACSTRLSRHSDTVTAKEVLEADLWVKPKNRCESNNQPGNFYLETIIENRSVTIDGTVDEIHTTRTFETTSEKLTNFCIEISPPKKVGLSKTMPIRRISPKKNSKIIKGKPAHEIGTLKKKVQLKTSVKKTGNLVIPGVRITRLSLTGLNKQKDQTKVQLQKHKETSVKLHDPNDFIMKLCNPDPFAASVIEDPFLASTLYYDDKWMHEQEIVFEKWLNTLLSPPEHLNTNIETACIDVGKVWQSCRLREETVLAETKEAVSARYHTNVRLNTLRKAACAMFRRNEVVNVLSRTTVCVEKGILTVRVDRNLHKDVGLQKEVLELFLSYNPLWLRIGLETIYGETIPLHSNDDLIGLTRFLLTRFFSDPFLVKNNAHPHLRNQPAFIIQINKFMLKKFLLLVYFLDYAKCNKLIGHDPCLFHKRAVHKDSRSILLTFSREVLSGIGDITKVLRPYGYILLHKQTYLDEYDYAVKSIATDLRDGVRLTRLMELITGKKDLTQQCRVPAISRLQKVHNVDVALKALQQCDYELSGNIEAKNIADGHREKSLSLLWQIIYKYQAPRFNKAAETLQRWWRAMLWYVRVKHFLQDRRVNAACIIQRAWRIALAKRELNHLKEKQHHESIMRLNAARIVQTYWRHAILGRQERNKFLQKRSAAIRLQTWWRRVKIVKPDMEMLKKKRTALILLQTRWRAEIAMKRERREYIILRNAVIIVQRRWRMYHAVKIARTQYLLFKSATICIQRRWRGNRIMYAKREHYQQALQAVRTIQNWWRSLIKMKRARNDYIMIKYSVRVIERWWLTVLQRRHFISTQKAVLFVQRTWRMQQLNKERKIQLKIRVDACYKIQAWWKSIILVRQYRLLKKSCVIIQRYWLNVLMGRKCQAEFVAIRNAAITVQRYWRGKRTRKQYLKLKHSVLKVQLRYRSILVGRAERDRYINMKKSIICIQNWWRSLKLAHNQHQIYLDLRKAVQFVQTRRRALLVARPIAKNYLLLKQSTILIQTWWRMVHAKKRYNALLAQSYNAVVTLQRRWRAKLLARTTKAAYDKLKSYACKIQNRRRATIMARAARKEYVEKKLAALTIQGYWRQFMIAKQERKEFCKMKNAAICIQRHFRANKAARLSQLWYSQLRKFTVKIQRIYRTKKICRQTRDWFLRYRQAAITIQSHWRKKIERRKYLTKRKAITTIQSQWRAYSCGKRTRLNYLLLKKVTINIQRRYRAEKVSKIVKAEYDKLRITVLWIQSKWRSKRNARICASILMKQESAAIIIQHWWRCIKFIHSHPYIREEECYRMKRDMTNQTLREIYDKYTNGAIRIQTWWRRIALKQEKSRKLINSVQIIESWWLNVQNNRKKCKAATRIQACWKGYKTRKNQCARMTEVRQRCKDATKNAVFSATLAYRCEEAIKKFTCCESIGQLSMSLTALDTVTRLSPSACITLCEMNLVDNIYGTLAQSNRSLPWMVVNTRATSILVTLAKFSATQKYVRKIDYANVIIQLLTASLEFKELFLNLATLFWTLGQDQTYVEEVLVCHQRTWLLTSLYNKVSKKKNKQVINSAKSREQVYLLPNSKPDWGLKQKQPRAFTDIQFATSTIMKQFQV